MIEVDISNVWGQLALPDLLAMERDVFDAHSKLMGETGEEGGRPALPELPLHRDGEAVREILACAEKIRSESEVCVVADMGGSYPGVRAAMELLQGEHRNTGRGKGDPRICFTGNNLSTRHWKQLQSQLEEKDFSICFENKILPQIEEIMTNYGDIFLAWFDVPMTLSETQSKTIYDTVKRLQPNCLINSRLGNGAYDYVSLGDNEIPASKEEWARLCSAPAESVNYQSIDGFKPSRYGLYESACTLNNSWGFSYRDHNWKTPEELFRNKTHLNELGINYLINVGPDHLGRIPGPSIEILRKVAEMGK